jgi:hypothetical protein
VQVLDGDHALDSGGQVPENIGNTALVVQS